MFRRWFAIDPGAHTLRIYDFTSERSYSIRSVLGFDYKKNDRAGQPALEYIQREKPRYQIRYPLNQARILSDISLLIRIAMQRLDAQRYMFRPSFLVAVPHHFPSAQKEKWEQMLRELGASRIEFIDRCHLLQGNDICFAVHAGHSSVTIYIACEDQVLASKDLPFGGLHMDEAIMNEIAFRHRILISQEEAMKLRQQASDLLISGRNGTIMVQGLSRQNQMVQIPIKAMAIWPCMEESERQIAMWARSCFDPLPLEIRQSLLKSGITLSGGLASCFGLEQILEQQFNSPVHVVRHPERYILEHMKGWK